MTLQVTREFQGGWTAFWATTYTFDIAAFEEFWLPRLGDPPLNITVLMDGRRFVDLWPEDRDATDAQVGRVNQDYLPRGVHIRNAFHPKTYFFGNQKRGVMLVGSGNLSLQGLEEGCEVFSRFDSSNDEGMAAIAAWSTWMDALVRRLDDHLVTSRWVALRAATPWLQSKSGHSLFVTNLDQPLTRLLEDACPRELHLYLGTDTSVDGARLAAVLDASGVTAHIRTPTQPMFIHAKLAGTVTGTSGRLLAGSANMSRAAMTTSINDPWGNVEAGVLLDLEATQVRSAFAPPGVHFTDMPRELLAQLAFRTSTESTSHPLILRSASRLPDGRVSVS